jgi:hypothetical protein
MHQFQSFKNDFNILIVKRLKYAKRGVIVAGSLEISKSLFNFLKKNLNVSGKYAINDLFHDHFKLIFNRKYVADDQINEVNVSEIYVKIRQRKPIKLNSGEKNSKDY